MDSEKIQRFKPSSSFVPDLYGHTHAEINKGFVTIFACDGSTKCAPLSCLNVVPECYGFFNLVEAVLFYFAAKGTPVSDLKKLAQEHASLRWRRNLRNQELWALGINPHGPEALVYRRHFHAAVAAQRVGQVIDRGHVYRLVLWLPPAEAHDDAVRRGLIPRRGYDEKELERCDYEHRVWKIADEARQRGIEVVLIEHTPDQVVERLRAEGLHNDSLGRGLIWQILASE